MRKAMTKSLAILIAFAVSFTCIPVLSGQGSAHAAAIKGLSASARGSHTVVLSWSKLSKKQKSGQKGITVFRDGYAIANISKKATSFTDTGLAAGTYHTYQVKTYKVKTKKTKMWFNKATGQYQKKKPAKKNRGKRKTFKSTSYKYKNASGVAGAATARAVAAAPAPNSGSAGGSTGNTGGGGSTGTTPSTRVTVIDYMGVEREVDKNSVAYKQNPQRVDRTVDGEFDGMIQRKGVTFTGDGMTVYNGDINRLNVEILNECESVNTRTFWKGDEYKKTRYYINSTNAVDGAGKKYHIAEAGKDYITKEEVYSNAKASCAQAHLNITDSPFGTGFTDDAININVSYDFNGDGDFNDAGEQIKKYSIEVKADTDRKAAIAICQQAVSEAGTNSYDADMQAIADKVNTYPYGKKVDGTTLMMRCIDGAYILQTWSIYKYGVFGYVSPSGNNPEDNDVDFWPENNPYSVRASWHAQGHK